MLCWLHGFGALGGDTRRERHGAHRCTLIGGPLEQLPHPFPQRRQRLRRLQRGAPMQRCFVAGPQGAREAAALAGLQLLDSFQELLLWVSRKHAPPCRRRRNLEEPLQRRLNAGRKGAAVRCALLLLLLLVLLRPLQLLQEVQEVLLG
jgi:hypothetical protein